MFTNEDLVNNTGYWLDKIQNDLHYELKKYMLDRGFNRTQLADDLGFTKGYISQVLNGNFNFSLTKLIDLSLAIGVVPKVYYTCVNEEIDKLDKLNNVKVIDLHSYASVDKDDSYFNKGIIKYV